MKAFIISGLPVLVDTLSEILLKENFEICIFINNLNKINCKIETEKPELVFVDPIFIPGITYPAKKGGEYYQEIFNKNDKFKGKIVIMYFFERIKNKDKFSDIDGIINFPSLSIYKEEITKIIQNYKASQKILVHN